MADGSRSPDEDEHRRKRLRKGTTSCWECKRRKIRCLPDPNGNDVCLGCQNRATACVSQEYPSDYIPARSTAGNNQLGQRLSRVENLLHSLVQKVSAQTPSSHTHPSPALSEVHDTSLDHEEPDTTEYQHAQIISVFDSAIMTPSQSQSTGHTPGSMLSSSSKPSPKEQKLRQTLAALLPSEHDAQLISSATNAWALAGTLCAPTINTFQEHKPDLLQDLDAVSKSHPIIIARMLMQMAICLQQVPEGSISELQSGPDIDTTIEKYTSAVFDLVTSNDEYMGTVEGLELLVLQGIFHLNAGNLRRSWLTSRRALSMAELMSFHKSCSFICSKNPNIDSTSAMFGKHLYHFIINSNRYLGVLLSLPCGSDDPVFEPHENFQNPDIDTTDLFFRKLSIIAGALIRRNQAEATRTFTATQVMVDMIDNLHLEMPSTWWQVPDLSSVEDPALLKALADRMLIQMYYFQLEGMVHFPFMLRSERRYEFSKLSCSRASREILLRYKSLRSHNKTQLCCRLIDFTALKAAIFLVLNFSRPTNQTEFSRLDKESDRALVKHVMKTMEELATDSTREVVAAQSVEVLKTLLAADAGTMVGHTSLNIPYLGTIIIARRPGSITAVADLEAYLQQHHGILPETGTLPGGAPPVDEQVISFSSSQFPMFDTRDWHAYGNGVPNGVGLGFVNSNVNRGGSINGNGNGMGTGIGNANGNAEVQDQQDWNWVGGADAFFFDSLLGTDLEGNWMS